MECIGSTQQRDHLIQGFPLNCGAHVATHVAPHHVLANANSVSFSLMGATGETYKGFINDLRKALTLHSQIVYGIPALAATATGLAQFLLVNLTNYKGESITVAINVVDVYVVAYQAGNKAYFLEDIPKEAKTVLFKGIQQVPLKFKGNYDELERHAGKIPRENIDLGFSELSSAIGNLFHCNEGKSVARGFIVIIQTLAEAARFKYIEKRVSENVETKFRPDPAFLSLENRWSNLSVQILLAQKHGGKFEHPVEVRSVNNKPILVSDVNSPVVKGIALLLNKSKGNNNGELLFQESFNNNNNKVWENARGEFGVNF